jgi:hypothetical protein
MKRISSKHPTRLLTDDELSRWTEHVVDLIWYGVDKEKLEYHTLSLIEDELLDYLNDDWNRSVFDSAERILDIVKDRFKLVPKSRPESDNEN